MTTTSDVGISPVLLQAITHTLSGRTLVKSDAQQNRPAENGHHVVIASNDGSNHSIIKMDGGAGVSGVGGILHGMNQQVIAMPEEQSDVGCVEEVTCTTTTQQPETPETVIIVHANDDEVVEHVDIASERIPSHTIHHTVSQTAALPRHVILKNGTASMTGSTGNVRSSVTGKGNDVNMGSVLTAIASQLRNRNVNIVRQSRPILAPQGSPAAGDATQVQQEHIGELQTVQAVEGAGEGGTPQQIYVTYASNINVPSPANDITVSGMENVDGNAVTETVIQTSPTDLSSGSPAMKQFKLDIPTSASASDDQEERTVIVMNPVVEGEKTTYQLAPAPFAWKDWGGSGYTIVTTTDGAQDSSQSGIQVATTSTVPTAVPWQPCPICGDRISGKLSHIARS